MVPHNIRLLYFLCILDIHFALQCAIKIIITIITITIPSISSLPLTPVWIGIGYNYDTCLPENFQTSQNSARKMERRRKVQRARTASCTIATNIVSLFNLLLFFLLGPKVASLIIFLKIDNAKNIVT